MRFSISSTSLCNRLVALSKVINSKNSLPILGDFLFELRGQRLHLTASDSEVVLNTWADISECDEDGSFCIGNHDLLEAVKAISEQPITFEVNMESRLAKIHYLNGELTLPVDSAEDFPPAKPMEDGSVAITLPVDTLASCITRSLFATAQDELRPVMNGIYFDLTTTHLAIVASDGHKLVRNKVLSVSSDQPSSFILPKKPATLLKAILVRQGGDAVIRYNDRNAEISFEDGTLQCRLIEGRYPNYNSVIPQGNPNQLTVDRLGLLAALRRVQPFANDSSNLIRFHVENGTLQLNAEDYDFSKTASESMTCEYNGMPMSIGFKGAAFIDVLNNFDGEQVIIQLADPSRAGLVVPAEQPQDLDVLMLMMPMLIND